MLEERCAGKLKLNTFARRGATPSTHRAHPTIDLIDYDYPPWHTADDTLDKLSPENLQTIGAVTLFHLRKALTK